MNNEIELFLRVRSLAERAINDIKRYGKLEQWTFIELKQAKMILELYETRATEKAKVYAQWEVMEDLLPKFIEKFKRGLK